mgnify:CR=1 FL=1
MSVFDSHYKAEFAELTGLNVPLVSAAVVVDSRPCPHCGGAAFDAGPCHVQHGWDERALPAVPLWTVRGRKFLCDDCARVVVAS